MSNNERRSAVIDILLVIVVGIGTKLVFTNVEFVGWRFSSFPAFGVVLVMTTWMLRKGGWYWRDVGLTIPVTTKKWLITIGQALLAMIVIAAISMIFAHWIEQYFATVATAEGRFEGINGHFPTYMMWVFFAIAVGGFAEEMIFRGFLINRVETLLTNKAPILKSSAVSIIAIIFPALLFGFAHFYAKGMGGAIRISISGVVSGLFYLAYGRRLLPLVIGHAAWDVLIMTAYYLESPGDDGFWS
jgi:membrane protease YdiL (CAAX protease family)